MAYNKPISRMTPEEFEEHLKKLATMTPEEKRKYRNKIDRREKDMAENHALMNEDIRAARAFEDEWKRTEPDFEGGEG